MAEFCSIFNDYFEIDREDNSEGESDSKTVKVVVRG